MGKKKGKRRSGKSKQDVQVGDFRREKTAEAQGHIKYISRVKGKTAEGVGLTHSPRTKGVNNIPLEKNPSPTDTSQAYVRPKTTEAPKGSYGKRLLGWMFRTKKDEATVAKIIDNSKAKPTGKKTPNNKKEKKR